MGKSFKFQVSSFQQSIRSFALFAAFAQIREISGLMNVFSQHCVATQIA
jgi:hypothetical protein